MVDHLFSRCVGYALIACLALCGMVAADSDDCVQGKNCHLPECFCPTYSHPLGKDNIPQIVYFGFDDAVQVIVSRWYNSLFTKERKNPNGCPITMTLYISDKDTDYNLVNKYYKKGDGMGVHSVTHSNIDTAAKLLEEAAEQKMNIEKQGQVPSADIMGWRSPNLKTAGDDQPKVLKQLNYTYDNSLTYTRDRNYPFPFTLDYGYPYPCMVNGCPKVDCKYKGFWEVMVHSLTDPESGLPCGYVDGCRPTTKDDSLEYLWSNFLDTYENEKAPFGLNMHASWFAFPGQLEGMQLFIDRLLELPDVYIVSVEKMMSWMKDPTRLSEINSFQPWGCTSRPVKRSNNPISYYRPQTQPRPAAPTTKITTTTTTTTTSEKTVAPTVMSATTTKASYSSCVQEKNCFLPNCFCKTDQPPVGLSPKQIPQVIYLAVSSIINGYTFGPITELLWPSRIDPNGRPIPASIFVPMSGNYPPYMNSLSNMGVKFGLRLESNRYIPFDDINQARKKLSAYYGVYNFEGRTGHLDQVSKAFQALNVTYDSFIVQEGTGFTWPNTLDFGLSAAECSPFTGGCLSKKYPGLWNVELSPMDGLPGSVMDTYLLMKSRFEQHYSTSRSPFGIHINESWLTGLHNKERVRGVNLFLNYIIRRADVLLLPIDEMLAWTGFSGRYFQRA